MSVLNPSGNLKPTLDRALVSVWTGLMVFSVFIDR